MADNVIVSQNVGVGATVATDDIGGVQYQRVKLALGADGVSDGDVSSANPMPVNVASLPLPAGAAVEAKQDSVITALGNLLAELQLKADLTETQPVDVPKEVFSQCVPTITEPHLFIHKGEMFRYRDAITLGSGVSQDYLLTTPATPWPHLNMTADGTAVTSFLMYEATDKTGTALQTAFNANRNSANAPLMTIHKGTTGGTTDGTQLFIYASGVATSGSSRAPSDVEFAGEWMLKANTKYIIRITSGTSGNLCNISLEWYEHVYGT